MFTLVEESAHRALRERLPTKSGTLIILAPQKEVPQARNLVSVSLPDGSSFEGGFWVTPENDRISVRGFDEKPDMHSYDLAVLAGEALAENQTKNLEAWRKRAV